MDNQELWNKCIAFHGHACGGLTIGYKAAIYAIELLGISFSKDEDIVCVCENDACGVDAIQVILGCSMGKGNLLFHMSGKQAFNFYDRKSNKSIRLILKKKPNNMTKEQSFDYYQNLSPKQMFDVMATKIILPEPARIFDSYECACCHEITGANWIKMQEGKMVCRDCASTYDRFNV
ncbi:MAG: FmdE family protein [Erysipelotrichaceae bacterium]